MKYMQTVFCSYCSWIKNLVLFFLDIRNNIIYRTSYIVWSMVSNAKISKLFTRKTCYQNMLCKYIKVFKSCASLTLNRMHVVYWKNNKHQHRVQLQTFPTVETQVIFEVFFSKLCSKFGACNCGNWEPRPGPGISSGSDHPHDHKQRGHWRSS